MKGAKMAQLRMEFHRMPHDGPACLEYSWVPEGLRRNIVLNPGEPSGYNDDTVDDSLKPSHVQVYVATNAFPIASLQDWQFPSMPHNNSYLVGARVELDSMAMKATGVAMYADGHTTTDVRDLEGIPRECPTGLDAADG